MKKTWAYIVEGSKVLLGFILIFFSFTVVGFLAKIVWKLFLLEFNVW